MPPKGAKRKAAADASRAKPAATVLNSEQHAFDADDDSAESGIGLSAEDALARECPELKREVDAHLARIDAEGTVAVVLSLRVREEAVVRRKTRRDESETVSLERRARIGPRRSSASFFSHTRKKKKNSNTVERRIHGVLIPLGERQDEEIYHKMKAQLFRLPTQVRRVLFFGFSFWFWV